MYDILVVEDDVTLRKLLAFVLSEAGYIVREACSAEDAVSAISFKTPDLMILDVCLPLEDGFFLVEHIREICQCLPIIIHTASDFCLTERDKLTLGKVRYIQKTAIDLQDIPEVVRSLLQ